MISDTSKLPDDPTELKKIIAALHVEQRQFQEELRHNKSEIELLLEQVAHLYNKLFGPKSEKDKYGENSPQLPLFDMPEPDPDSDEQAEEKKVEIKSHTRVKGGRKPLPDSLPRREIIHDIPEEDKICHCGAEMSKIGEEVSEKLDIIPAVIQVIRHIRLKYTCTTCENIEGKGATVKIAPVPPQLLAKGIASGGLMAHIITAKFTDALPFYRQEKQFSRLGTEFSRTTMCRSAMKVAQVCMPLKNLLHQEILSGPLINADETTVQVLKEPGKAAKSKSYMWVFRGGDPNAPSFYFHYHKSRAREVVKGFLDGYTGVVQTDGYAAYDFLDTKTDICHLGCLAHARRKFMDAKKARGKNCKKTGGADAGLKFIKDLYRVENKIADLSPQERIEIRNLEAKPTLDKMHNWLVQKSNQVTPGSLLGKAISYSLNQWKRLEAYVDVECATPDNNLAENAIRPFCVGRKNWLFAGTPEGAQASATFYSLIESAKANGLEPYRYLRYIFEKLPFVTSDEDYIKLLPSRLSPAELETVSQVSRV